MMPKRLATFYRSLGAVTIISMFIVGLGRGAWGQADVLPKSGEKLLPWHFNVSSQDRQIAKMLFERANRLLEDKNFGEAANTYRRALLFWDNPAIHFNLALTLLQLDKPIESHIAVSNALRYERSLLAASGLLTKQQYDWARTLEKLTRQQIVAIEVFCSEPGAVITSNNRFLFTGPGIYRGWERPGTIQMMATKPGHVNTIESRRVRGGERVRFILKLYTPKQMTQYRRHMSPSLPWIVVGTGTMVLALGVVFRVTWRTERTAAFALSATGGAWWPRG